LPPGQIVNGYGKLYSLSLFKGAGVCRFKFARREIALPWLKVLVDVDEERIKQ
jgi:hypothetical protein